MNKTIACISFMLVATLQLSAQQLNINNQHLVNKYALSPAFSGANGYFESFISYRKDWSGITGSPLMQSFNVNGAINENMGVGASVISEEVGLFKTLSASLSYAYFLKIANKQSLSFGVSAGVLSNNFDFENIKSTEIIDPVVVSNQQMNGTAFNATAGLLYRNNNFHIGVAVPQLLESKITNELENANVLYTLKRHYLAHVSWALDVSNDWQIEPSALIRTNQTSPLLYEVATLVKYHKQLWLGATYRKTGIGVSAGGTLFNKIVMNYTYEFGGQGMLGKSTGTHDVSLGILIGNLAKTSKKKSSSVFESTPEQPYYEFMNE